MFIDFSTQPQRIKVKDFVVYRLIIFRNVLLFIIYERIYTKILRGSTSV